MLTNKLVDPQITYQPAQDNDGNFRHKMAYNGITNQHGWSVPLAKLNYKLQCLFHDAVSYLHCLLLSRSPFLS